MRTESNSHSNRSPLLQRSTTATAATLCMLALAGCSAGLGGSAAPAVSQAAIRIGGTVHGGQQPVVGAAIQLYTVGTSGIASASTPLLPAGSVQTNASGGFTISGLYSCSGATQVYLVALGGNSGSGNNSANAAMAALGSCATLQTNAATTFIQVNELTTIASAYALAPFASDYAHIGATGSNPAGLVNAFANASILVNTSTGTTPGAGLATGVTVPTTELNTVADIIAACINSSASNSPSCNAVLSATAATDTIGAAFGIVKNPAAAAVTSLFTQVTPSAPFQPALAAKPADFTVAVNYSAGGTMLAPYGIAIDATGNAWVSNSAGSAVTKLSSAGALLSNYSGGGLIGAKGIAIDRSGNVWLANTPKNAIVEFNASGILVSPAAGYITGGFNAPVALALDSAGNAWIANQNSNSVVELNALGLPTAGSGTSGFTAGGSISGPTGVAIDSAGNVLVSNSGAGNLVKLTNAGAAASGSPLTDVALQGTSAVAVDSAGNIWATGSTTGFTLTGSVSQFASTGLAAATSPSATGPSASQPYGIATSSNTAIITNNATAGSITVLRAATANPVSPTAGYGVLNAPVGVAVDASGSVWTANSGDNTVSVFIGLTAPVLTPIAANVGP